MKSMFIQHLNTMHLNTTQNRDETQIDLKLVIN